jgi:hypothetical protein
VGRELERGGSTKRASSPLPHSSFLRQEERRKYPVIGHFSTCVDTNAEGEMAGVMGKQG